MKKKSWSECCKILVCGRRTQRFKKYLKRMRNRQRRRYLKNVENEFEARAFEQKSTDSWWLC